MAQTLFVAQVPGLPDNDDGAPGIGTATTVQFAAAGQVTGIQFRATTTVSGTYVIELWQVTDGDDTPAGTILATKTLPAPPTAGAYNQVSFDTPVAVVTGTLYRCVLWSSAGRYVATLSFFNVPLTNGDITAYANGDDPNPPGFGAMRQGTFVINGSAGNYPSGNGNQTCYFVGPVFDLAAVASASVCFVGGFSSGTAPKTATGASTGQAGLYDTGVGVKTVPSVTIEYTGLHAAGAATKQTTGAATAAVGLQGTGVGVKTTTSTSTGLVGLLAVDGRPEVDLTIGYGVLGPKWQPGILGSSTGQRGPLVNQSVLSTAYIQIPVSVSAAGAPFDPTLDTVSWAFTTPTGSPTVWYTGSWDTDPAGTPLAQVLVGPSGTVTLARGTYTAWVKITDNPEIPVAAVGTVQIN